MERAKFKLDPETWRTTVTRARDLRRDMTATELRLWEELRGRKLARLKFRRQHPLGIYIVDFYAPAVRLAVELDGPYHDDEEQKRRDERRQHFLEARGIRFVRIKTEELEDDIEGCLKRILKAAGREDRTLDL